MDQTFNWNSASDDLDGFEFDETLAPEAETETVPAKEVLIAHSAPLSNEQRAFILGTAREFQRALIEEILRGES